MSTKDEELLSVTRKTHTFNQRMIYMLKIWYPDRPERSLQDTINGFYTLEQFFPKRDGEPCPVVENNLVRHLVTYRSLDR